MGSLRENVLVYLENPRVDDVGWASELCAGILRHGINSLRESHQTLHEGRGVVDDSLIAFHELLHGVNERGGNVPKAVFEVLSATNVAFNEAVRTEGALHEVSMKHGLDHGYSRDDMLADRDEALLKLGDDIRSLEKTALDVSLQRAIDAAMGRPQGLQGAKVAIDSTHLRADVGPNARAQGAFETGNRQGGFDR